MKLLIAADDTLGAFAIEGPLDVSEPTRGAPKGGPRKTRILAHLKAASEPMRKTEVTMSGFRRVKCMDEFTLSVPGSPVQTFLWTSPDDKTLYWLGEAPFAISKSIGEIKAERDQNAARDLAALKALIQRVPTLGQGDARVHVAVFIDPANPDSSHAVRLLQSIMTPVPPAVRAAAFCVPPPPAPKPASDAPSLAPAESGWSKTAALGALCAAQQAPAHYWEMLRGYLQHQIDITDSSVLGQSTEYARKLPGIDLAAWTACVTDPASPDHRAVSQLLDDAAAFARARDAAVPGTFIINSRVIPLRGLTRKKLMIEVEKQLRQN